MFTEIETNVKQMLNSFENDTDFQELIKKYNSPNCFTIMGNKRREEWHSNFVKWLLDPNENHKLGTYPLERFLNLIEEKSKDKKLSRTNIDNMRFITEYSIEDRRRIDIFGISESLVLVIENKIKAKETFKEDAPQTNSYYNYCERKYKDKQRCYILLKADPKCIVENENFISITYQELFDNVIKPVCSECVRLERADTKKVLDQYILDISNPVSNSILLAHTEKEKAETIFKKHEKTIDLIRKTMRDLGRDKKSLICKFFDKYNLYINKIILESIKKDIIKPRLKDKLEGKELIKYLLDYQYVIPYKTELIYHRYNKTFAISITEDEMCYTGFYNGTDYDGSQNIEPIHNGQLFETIRKAIVAVEIEAGSTNSNPGISPYECILLNTGNEEAEGKKIREVL